MDEKSAGADFVSAVIGWDVRNWSRALPFWQPHIHAKGSRTALAIGDRGGGTSLWVASQGIPVVCTDHRVSLEQAKALHRRFDVDSLVMYRDLDVTDMDYPDRSFDIVILKSVLGALATKERQIRAMHEIHRVLRPGGTFLFAENLVGSRLHVLLRSRFVPWNGSWRYVDLGRDGDLFDAFATVTLETWGVMGSFGRTEGQRDLLGRIDEYASQRVPPYWRYIVFGACVRGAD